MRKVINIVIPITIVLCISLTIIPVKAVSGKEDSEITSVERRDNEDARKAKEEYVKEYIGSFTNEELDSLIEYIQNKESDKKENKKNTENTIGELLWFICFLVIAAVIFSKFA